MALLARNGWLGAAKEASGSPGVYLPPTINFPYTGSSGFEDMIASIRDESVRADDSVLHGVYQGPAHAEWAIDHHAYPDLVGHLFAATVGPDTVTAATATTLSANTLVNATAVSSAVALPAGTVVKVGTGLALEYAWTDGAATGAGPYTSNVTTVLGRTGVNRVGLLNAHTSGDPVLTTTLHTFKQNPAIALPTYSFTYFDTVGYISCSYGRFSDLQIKIDPKGAISFSSKAMSFPSVPASLVAPAFSPYDPLMGWSWNMTSGGASSTRGLSYDATIKRAVEAIQASDGTQAPREVFAGAIEYSGTLKAIYENGLDLNLYLQNTQLPFIVSAQQPVVRGGQSLTVTSSKSAFTKGKRDLSQPYAQADFSIDGIANTTDGGVLQVALANWQTTAY
ncbi:hypothetical protein ABIA32_002690 [Streptacidiphilus sp. MAP12-20]|uniref:hypothetical protein n=1 Tax=Streptacidiphilus sp. MAP12-20 TaxID=3156299 RepID=UPI0035114C31